MCGAALAGWGRQVVKQHTEESAVGQRAGILQQNNHLLEINFIYSTSTTMQILQEVVLIIRFFMSSFNIFQYFQTCHFTGCPAKLFPLDYLLFCRLLLMQISKVGMFLKNSGDLLHDRHKNFENRFRNSRDN